MGQNMSDVRNNSAQSQQRQSDNFPALLKQSVNEIKRALPSHLSADRIARVALTAFRRNPSLAKCDPRSVLGSVIQSSQLGLEPDTLGRSFLVPYGKECQFIPGWKGLVDLVNRSGKGTVWTGAVFEGDEFDYSLGDSPFVKHKPMGEYEADKLTHVYAVGRPNGAEWPIIEVWPVSRVWKHRDRYNKVGKKHYSFGNEEMYARKVVLLQVLKYMPMSVEMERAISLNDAAEQGNQGVTIEGAISGEYDPPAPEPEPEPEKQVGGDDGSTKTQDKAQSAPAKGQQTAKPEGDNPSSMSFDDAMDFIRTCPADAEGEAESAAILENFSGNEANILKEIYDQRFGGGEPQQRELE